MKRPPTPWHRGPKPCPRLADFLRGYLRSRTDLSPARLTTVAKTIDDLLAAFHDPRYTLDDITLGDADRFLRMLRQVKGENTARKHIAVCKMFWLAAVRDRLTTSNPWTHIPSSTRPNPNRSHFVTREDAAKLLDACPNTRWRTIVALARYGGLRCPSEVAVLRWADIDFPARRFTVRSPKTAAHLGHEERVVPIFRELLPFLEEARAIATGADVVLLEPDANLRTLFKRIIRKAGLEPWPKPFQNLRASRDTELHDQFPPHVVAAWMGHSPRVSAAHYCVVTTEHFERASGVQSQGMSGSGGG